MKKYYLLLLLLISAYSYGQNQNNGSDFIDFVYSPPSNLMERVLAKKQNEFNQIKTKTAITLEYFLSLKYILPEENADLLMEGYSYFLSKNLEEAKNRIAKGYDISDCYEELDNIKNMFDQNLKARIEQIKEQKNEN